MEAPEDVKKRLTEAQHRLATAVTQSSIRWVGPEQFHLTLRFLGNVAAERLENLASVFHQACAQSRPMRLRAEGIGFFPRPHAPRVVWAGIRGDVPALGEFQRRIEAAVQPFSAEPGQERFHAHITLGRIKSITRAELDTLSATAGGMSTALFGEWTAAEVQLIRSQLSPNGARYSVVCTAELPPS